MTLVRSAVGGFPRALRGWHIASKTGGIYLAKPVSTVRQLIELSKHHTTQTGLPPFETRLRIATGGDAGIWLLEPTGMQELSAPKRNWLRSVFAGSARIDRWALGLGAIALLNALLISTTSAVGPTSGTDFTEVATTLRGNARNASVGSSQRTPTPTTPSKPPIQRLCAMWIDFGGVAIVVSPGQTDAQSLERLSLTEESKKRAPACADTR
jgi:hypothetical protein